jgi:hypothetical protein
MRQVNYAGNVKVIMPLPQCFRRLPYEKHYDNADILAKWPT